MIIIFKMFLINFKGGVDTLQDCHHPERKKKKTLKHCSIEGEGSLPRKSRKKTHLLIAHLAI